MWVFTDQTGHRIELEHRPRRIVSLVPSQSELLWDLGLQPHLAGITKFCIHPQQMFRSVPRIGGTKTLNLQKIRDLDPDLIIANKEENEKEQIEALRKEFRVWTSDIYTFEDAFSMMKSIGEMTGKESEATQLEKLLRNELNSIKNIFAGETVAYFIWYKPWMLAGANTFIHHVLGYSGLTNAAASFTRYPVTDEKLIQNMNPQHCFLSSEPFPFKEKHRKELQELLPQSRIRLVDGEVFSWYGSRLLKLPAYLRQLKNEI